VLARQQSLLSLLFQF
jgi:hypothetical protein